jgi:hypothetical protein
MTADLRERLDDLLTEIPSHVDTDAGTTWRAGARRRARGHLVTAGAVLALLGIVGGAGLVAHRVTDPPPADGGATRPSASSYPTRIDAPLLRTGTLTDQGPIAGLIERNEGWFGVGQRGQVWRVAGATGGEPVSISPDGTRIAYVDASRHRSELELRDLIDGQAVSPGIEGSGSGLGGGWVLRGPGVTFWSPDSVRLFVPVRPGPTYRGPRVDALVVSPGQDSLPVRAPAGHHVEPLGWLAPTLLGWMRWSGDESHPDVVITGIRGGRVLKSAPAPGRIPFGQWVGASAMPNGGSRAHVLSVSTATRDLLISDPGRIGALVASPRHTRDRTLACPFSWTDSYPVFPVVEAPGSHLLSNGPRSYLVQADPSLQPVSCSVWAYDALRGDAHPGLAGHVFGDRNDWLSWHWRDVVLVGTSGLVVLGAALAWRHRRRGRRLPT